MAHDETANGHNCWLLSNSQFYFSEKLLNGTWPLNVYSLTDISNLMHAILFADKITTFLGAGCNTSISKELRQENILVELDVQEDFDKIISQLRAPEFAAKGCGIIDSLVFLIKSNKEQIAKVLHDTLKVDIKICQKAINEAGTWANETYHNNYY
jgi:hypothetical protein